MKTKALSVRNEAFLERTHACNSRVRISSIFSMSIRDDAKALSRAKTAPLPPGDEARHFWPSSTPPTRGSINIFRRSSQFPPSLLPLPSRVHRSFSSSSLLELKKTLIRSSQQSFVLRAIFFFFFLF